MVWVYALLFYSNTADHCMSDNFMKKKMYQNTCMENLEQMVQAREDVEENYYLRVEEESDGKVTRSF